ncbi:MAG: non-heme iron oxygenase ferredoxin subunit [Elusimicrobia bacterium]|nr:non-heme iron oxygenase ferredoxin subunit [Elusimicrobiota bacterium]
MWQKAARRADLKEGHGVPVRVAGRALALFLEEGQVYALRDECTHAGAPLSEGEVRKCRVTCPWHAAQFDIRTGESVGELGYNPVRSFPARFAGDDVEVDIP